MIAWLKRWPDKNYTRSLRTESVDKLVYATTPCSSKTQRPIALDLKLTVYLKLKVSCCVELQTLFLFLISAVLLFGGLICYGSCTFQIKILLKKSECCADGYKLKKQVNQFVGVGGRGACTKV